MYFVANQQANTVPHPIQVLVRYWQSLSLASDTCYLFPPDERAHGHDMEVATLLLNCVVRRISMKGSGRNRAMVVPIAKVNQQTYQLLLMRATAVGKQSTVLVIAPGSKHCLERSKLCFRTRPIAYDSASPPEAHANSTWAHPSHIMPPPFRDVECLAFLEQTLNIWHFIYTRPLLIPVFVWRELHCIDVD